MSYCADKINNTYVQISTENQVPRWPAPSSAKVNSIVSKPPGRPWPENGPKRHRRKRMERGRRIRRREE
jgi:hypothetical protein